MQRKSISRNIAELEKEHQSNLSKLTDHQEIKDEKYVHKNRLFDAKMELEKELQQIKDRRHAAFAWQYHLIDLLRMSKFTFMETRAQKWENYKYTFNRRAFLAAERSVYCNYSDFYRTVYRYADGKGRSSAYL